MKKKTRIITCLLVVLLLVTAILPTSVFADSTTTITKSNAINSDYYYWGGQMIQYTFTYYDGTTITTNHGGFALHYAGANLTSIVGAQVAYCIDSEFIGARSISPLFLIQPALRFSERTPL